jgi:hypothetical protein
MRGWRVQRWSQVFAALERSEGKETSLDLLRGFCCSYDIPSCCHVFFWVVFLLFVEVLWDDVVELRVEH